jgi:hypothetical protein
MSEISERTEPDGTRTITFRTSVLTWFSLLMPLVVGTVSVLVFRCCY